MQGQRPSKQDVEKASGSAILHCETAQNAHLLPCKLRFFAVLRLVRHLPDDFSAPC
jgi:hypothetical protein